MAEGGQVRRKKAVPAFTVENIIAALKGLESRWYRIGLWLGVPPATQNHMRTQHSTDSARLRDVINYTLSLHPSPGWRIIINALHGMEEQASAARIQEYAEPVTDHSLTVDTVATVMSVMKRRWDATPPGGGHSLANHLDVSWSKQEEIRQQHRSLPQQQIALARYGVDFLPRFSWSTLAGTLYICEEEAALQAARRYIKREKDPTLTLDNLLSILGPVTDWDWLGVWLDVPNSRRNKMTGKEEILQEWLLQHPCPCWSLLAWALYRTWEHTVLKHVYGIHVTAPQIEMRLNACRQAMRDKETIDQVIMQGLFLGLPRSGKTSSKKRLVGKCPTVQERSTGVIDQSSRVEIEKTTVYTWSEVTDLTEETAIIVDDIVDHVANTTEHDSSLEDVEQAGAKGEHFAEEISMETMSDERKQASVIPGEESTITPTDQLQAISTALHTVSNPRQQVEKKWILYLSDAGGQPEFQEMLPAVVSGPSLYFLTFPLHKGLNERFMIEYECPDGSSITPYELTYTMKEVLLQSLASISSTQSYITTVDGTKAISPKILFLATHKDKLSSKQELSEIDQQLQQTIKKTIAFEKDMIVFHSKPQMVFALDNTSNSEDDDIREVRRAVERIGMTSEEYKIKTPCTWMIFAINLRHLPERVISMNQCKKVAKASGINTQEELNNALWFLHHNIGIIRHYQDHSKLQGFVINGPQYIFDKLTDLMIKTFTFESIQAS